MFKGEFLSPEGKLGHKTAFGVHESGHAVDIVSFRLNAGLRSATRAGIVTCGSNLGLGSHGYGDRLGGGVEFEITADELIIGPLVLEEDDLTEGFRTCLEPDRSLDRR